MSADGKAWKPCKQWFNQATGKAQNLGEIFHSQSNAFICQGFLYQGKVKGRQNSKKRGDKSRCTTDKYQQQNAKEPWLFVGIP